MKKIILFILLFFTSLTGFSQILLSPEGFENTTGPNTTTSIWNLPTGEWFVFDDGGATSTQNWGVSTTVFNQGSQSADSFRGENIGAGNTLKEYLVTPLITLPATGTVQLKFYSRTGSAFSDPNTTFEVCIGSGDPVFREFDFNYTSIQTWTEAQLVGTSIGVFREITVTMPAGFEGQDIYLAFRKTQFQAAGAAEGDRWFIDDVSVQVKCDDPVLNTLAASTTQTVASLSWGAVSGISTYEVEVVNDSATPSGTGNLVTGTNFDATTTTAGVPLAQGQTYQFYVRSRCGGTANPTESSGDWIGPFTFTMQRTGVTCAGAIEIPATLPYSSTSNTNLYGDSTDVTQPAGCVTSTTNFMTGNDVFYSYTPTTTGAINITMTPQNGANSTGLFVYQGCGNVGVTCVAGVANTGNGVRTIPSLNVIAGQTYIIVLSSNATATSTYDYTLVIQKLNCAQPTTLAAVPTQTTATLSWANPGGATSWEVAVQPAGDPIPAGAGITTTNNTNYITTTPLTPNTPYQYWVRADCGDGTFSIWSGPFLFRTLCDAFPVPFQEGFNSTSTTQNCWTVLNVNGDTDRWDMDFATTPFEGNQVASITTEEGAAGSNDDWLISPQLILTANKRLKFNYRVQSTTEPNDFRVVLSTTGIAPADFTQVLVPLTSYDNTDYRQAIVSLAAYTGPVYIAWHIPPGGPDGLRLFIDNVIIEDIPTCAEPTNVAATGAILATSATITWVNGGTETEWQVLALPCGSPAPAITTLGAPIVPGTQNLTGLTGSTCYEVYVRAVCTGPDYSPWSNPTTITTQVVPPACGGVYTDPAGPTAQYNNNVDSTVTICPDNPSQVVTVTFTSFNTEATFDGLYVFDGDSILSPQIASANGVGLGPLTTPGAFWGNLTGANLPGPFTSSDGSGCLTFRFRTDGSVLRDGFIANVTCPPAPTCRKPTNLASTSPTSSGATITWNQLPNPDTSVASEWHVLVLPCADPAPTATSTGFTIVNSTTSNLTLDPATCYNVYVRAACSATEFSAWAGPVRITTLCVPFNVPFFEGFNSNSTTQTCWTVLNSNNDGDAWNMNFVNNPFEGNECAALTTDFNAGANNDWLISPTIILNGNQRLKYHYRVQSAGEPNDFRVMLSQTGITPADFTQTLIPLATYNNITYVQNIVNLTGVTGPVNIAWHVPGGGLDGWRIFIDNVIIEDIPACAEPSSLTATQITPTSALLGWTQPNANVTEWEVIVQLSNLPAPLPGQSGTVVTINPATFTGLIPATQYTYYVRAICPNGGGFSGWSNGFTFTTLLINDNCENATFAPVNSSSVCLQTVIGTINGATASPGLPLTAPCIGNPDDDVWYQFVATNSYLSISLLNIVGSTTNLNMAVYSGACGSLTQISCSAANETTHVVNGMTVGQTYFIRVYSNQNTPQTSTFNLCISTPSTCITGSTVCNLTNYPNTTGVESITDIGCLGSAPNPYYFTVQVATSGPINFLLTQSTTPGGPANLDVDYAAWGPFTSQAAACTAIGDPIGLEPGIGVPVTITTGCSFSPAATETLNITNAVAGQYYIILITNFSDDPGYITLTQTNLGSAGHGTTNCCLDAFFTYTPASYCKTSGAANPIAVISNGSTPGVFSCSNPGLVFANTATGEINLAASAPGNYLITNTVAATANCGQKTATYTVNITEPLVATISYPVARACKSEAGTIAVNLTGAAGGTFSSTPPGLSINPTTGLITPSLSGSGNYTISYSYSTSSVCNAAAPSATIEIIANPIVAQPANITSCNNVTLNALTVGNYFSQTGGVDPINIANPLTTSQTVYVYANNNGCTTERSFTVTINSIPAPTVDIVHANCTTPTGTITVTNPLNTTGNTANDLFISEITDENVGSLSYIEIYNGTGSAKNLANYKLKIYNNGNSTPSNFCDFALTGTLSNNDVYVIAVGSATNVGGVVPDITIANCPGFNTNDNVRLTTSTDVEVDSWGRRDDQDFTPNNQSGYTYRRLNTASVPSLVWNPADWTALDPQDYTNVGSYTFSTTTSSNYEYQLDSGTFQTSPSFTNVVPGSHTITVRDIASGCVSAPLSVTINDITLTGTVTDFTLPRNVCKNDANPLPTPVVNFTSGGVFAVAPPTNDLVINASTGEIDLVASLAGTYTITYTIQENVAICQNFGQSSQIITINPLTVPTFSQVDPICAGTIINDVLPLFSNNALTPIAGSWSPMFDNTQTTTYIFTPDAGQCATTASMTIVVNPIITPIFDQVAPICAGETLNVLPLQSNNVPTQISGTWSPVLDNTQTTTYTFTPDAGQCAITANMTIVVNPNITPIFDQVTPICAGETLNALPLQSNNAPTQISGTWSPTLDNTQTTTYTFTPDAGQCATTASMTIVVNPGVAPDFAQVAPICVGGTLNALPILSNNFPTQISGTWSPALDNSQTTTYTFTPDAGQCATSASMTIVVNPIITPVFTQVGPICAGATLNALPTVSNNVPNSIAGTWSPTLDNTRTATYTFTPNIGQCGTSTTMTISVTPNETPTFNSVNPICSGDALTPLPTSSTNIVPITGIWSPALNNTQTTTYTFNPTIIQGVQCATPVQLQIVVNQKVDPNFTVSTQYCIGETADVLPLTSTDAAPITGTWNPSSINTTAGGSLPYTFTPNAGQCANPRTINVNVSSGFDFDIEGDCVNNAYTLSIVNESGNLDLNNATFVWQIGSTPIANTNNPTFNVTAYLNSTSANEVLPLSFSVTVTNSDGCTRTEQPFEVDSIACLIQKGISVNGDGDNDTFDLSSYDVRKLTIFNRYGTKAYEKTGYVNEWKGQTDNGDELPDGTYFYTIEFNSGGKAETGWIYVSRKN